MAATSRHNRDRREERGETGQNRGVWPAGGGRGGGGGQASVHISSKTSRHDSTRNIVLNQHSQPRLGLGLAALSSLHHLDVDDNANMKIMQEFSVVSAIS